MPGSRAPGSGGCVVVLVCDADADDVLAWSIARYGEETGLVPTGFLATAVDGART